jgi:hypothetical protein
MSRSLYLALFASASLVAGTAGAAGPVALVEDSSGRVPVGFMDYLTEGQKFTLGADASVTISYFNSCQRETISGASVTIGKDQSTVEGGLVKREKVECDGGKMLLSADQASKSGVLAFRGPSQLPEPQFTIYGATPVVEMKKAGTLVIQRLDKSAGAIEVTVAEKDLLQGRFFDLGKVNKSLDPGGLYSVRSDEPTTIYFKVDPKAKPGQGALVGRLLRL